MIVVGQWMQQGSDVIERICGKKYLRMKGDSRVYGISQDYLY